jgi:hypothetical protein
MKTLNPKTNLIEVLQNSEISYQPQLIKTLNDFDLLFKTKREIHLFDNSDDVNGISPIKPRFHGHIFESNLLSNGDSSLELNDDESNIQEMPDHRANYITKIILNQHGYLISLKVNECLIQRLRRQYNVINDNGFLSHSRFDPLFSTVEDLVASFIQAIPIFENGNGVRANGSSNEISKLLQDFKRRKIDEINLNNKQFDL